ncbi:DUF6283 family protein [Nocardia sp. CDC159]|uniref:DUF6283 family protein n=1 Tax=Nocardia pulmonis TaxID=2951408 RepID=A0A9X2IY28_9NOCA|nr:MULTISPECIES: DUF6283 family protein [Nocardia]MCM6774520.1 DUF6283 family protein [Nocardia pulmonis]MCM6787414.1 DUF6283 family protein [Nocardia sp. CDC159]
MTAPQHPHCDDPAEPIESVRHRKFPCAECPWRRDTAPGQFSQDRFDYLAATTGSPGQEVWLDAPLFACHKSPEGHEEACAGWLATVGYYHLGVRLAVHSKRLDPAALEAGPDWPELHTSYSDMVEAKAHRPETP